MSVEEIKAAVLSGQTVCWVNDRYKVCHYGGDWFIACYCGSTIGLTGLDGSLNGEEGEFYIQAA